MNASQGGNQRWQFGETFSQLRTKLQNGSPWRKTDASDTPSTLAIAATAARKALSRKRQSPTSSIRMREALQRSRAGIVTVLVLTAFLNVLKLTIPLYIFQLLDRVIASRSFDTLLLLTAITAFAVVVAAVADLIRRSMLGHWGSWIEEHFGKQLFLGSFDRRKARRPSKALEDLSSASGFVSSSGLSTWLDAMWAPAFLLIVFLIHPLLGLIVLAGMVAMVVLGILIETVTRPARAEMRKARLKGEAWLAAADHNPETVAGLSISEPLADRWQASVMRRAAQKRSSRLTSAALVEGMLLTEALQRIACYGVGVWLAIDGALSVGGIIAGAVLGRIGTSAVRRAMSHWRDLVLARRAFARISRRLETSQRSTTAVRDPDATMALHIDQLTFTHSQWSKPLFRQMELTVEPGEMLCIIGPSGAGKTSLARLVSGVASPTMGTVRLGGLDITRYTPAERRKLLGYMPQVLGLLDGTIADNIASLGSIDERALIEASRLAGIHDVIQALPKGYETRVGNRQSPLSGGELRRLALARALYRSPRLLVLDEPETNLDADLVTHLIASLDNLKKQGCVVVVTTQLDRLVELADKAVLLDRGAPPAVFTTREAVVSRLKGHAGTAISHQHNDGIATPTI